jgi:hypothetical protein
VVAALKLSYLASYIDTLFRCLIHSDVINVSLQLFDHRYFYPDDDMIGECTCGLARNVAQSMIRERNMDKFLSRQYLNSMVILEGNRCAIGSMVEQSCLAAINRFGLDHGKLHFKPKECQTYRDDIFLRLPRGKDCSMLFIPESRSNPHIDALYLELSHKEKPKPIPKRAGNRAAKSKMVPEYSPTAMIVPIQITISPRHLHTDSEARFYATWARWEKQYRGYKLSSTFLWIVEDESAWNEVKAQYRKTRNHLHVVMPPHEQAVIPIKTLHEDIGLALTGNGDTSRDRHGGNRSKKENQERSDRAPGTSAEPRTATLNRGRKRTRGSTFFPRVPGEVGSSSRPRRSTRNVAR